MSVNGTISSTFAFQKGGGLQVSQGNPIESRRSSAVQNLSLGQNVPRIPDIVTPVTGTNESFTARSVLTENDNEVYTFHFPAAADALDGHLMIANYSYVVDSVKAKFTTASSSGNIDIKVCDDGEAISSGTSVLASTMSIAGSADTNVSGSLTTTQANRKIAKGQSLAIDFGGITTSIAGLVVTVVLRRVNLPGRQGNYLE
jgi:hypothetical protein